MALILDTGPLYASIDRRDADHQACVELLSSTSERLVIPCPVLAELDYLITSRLGADLAVELLAEVARGVFGVVHLEPEDYERTREICATYIDSDIGFVDAAVLAIIERLNEPKLATLDRRHFGMMRPRHVETLRLLPEL